MKYRSTRKKSTRKEKTKQCPLDAHGESLEGLPPEVVLMPEWHDEDGEPCFK